MFDTGWVDVPVTLAGMSGTMAYTRYGKIVIVQIDLGGSLASGSLEIVGSLPVGIGPTQGRATGAAYFDGGYVGVVRITAGGIVAIAQQSGAARNNPVATVVFRLN